MGLLERVRAIIRANISDILNRAEDPEKALDQMIADMNENLVKARQAAALAIAAQSRLQAQYEQRIQAAEEWQRRAAAAVDRGDDDAARDALRRKLQYQREAKQLHESLQAQSAHLEDLRSNVEQLEARIQETILRRNQLVARYRTAEASQKLAQELARTGTLGATMEQLESKAIDAEAQAAAYHELSRDSLEERFAQLEEGTSVEDELAALKQQRLLGQGRSEG
ncbi:MAG: PspA/IM30 family protein [Chloroflexi bacterium]|nr:PspA/IM30 family protein [Chloroflexota bacterium]